jgi:hypothetical protein
VQVASLRAVSKYSCVCFAPPPQAEKAALIKQAQSPVNMETTIFFFIGIPHKTFRYYFHFTTIFRFRQ